MSILKIYSKKILGDFKILNAVNNGPACKRHAVDQARSNFQSYKDAKSHLRATTMHRTRQSTAENTRLIYRQFSPTLTPILICPTHMILHVPTKLF